MTDSRTLRFKGHLPPWLDESEDDEASSEWEISTVARRTTNADETATCALTHISVRLNEPHYFVTSKRETVGRVQPPEYDHAVLDFEHGLEELERQINLEHGPTDR